MRAWPSALSVASCASLAISCVWRTSSRPCPACSMAARVTSSTRRATRRLASTTVVPWASSRSVSATRGLHRGEGALGDGADLRQRLGRAVSELHARRWPARGPPAPATPRCPPRARTPPTMVAISRVERAVRSARPRISSATTPKGRPVLTGLRGDDGGVERQQVRLVGDLLDDVHDAANLRGARAERVHQLGRLAHRLLHPVHALDAVVDEHLAALGGGRHGVGRAGSSPWRGGARRRCPSAPRCTKASASLAKRASSSPEDAMWRSRSLMACTCSRGAVGELVER